MKSMYNFIKEMQTLFDKYELKTLTPMDIGAFMGYKENGAFVTTLYNFQFKKDNVVAVIPYGKLHKTIFLDTMMNAAIPK